MRDHREGQDPSAQDFDPTVIKRAWSSLHEISARRMGRYRALDELAYGAEKRALPKPPKPGRTTVRKHPGGKAGKILRSQR
jgi:hypothetical protein